MTQIKLIEKTWKSLFAIFVSLVLAFGGLFVSIASTSAHGNPNITVRTLVSEVEDQSQGWTSNLNTQGGRTVKFYIEIHNTVVGSNTHNTKARVDLPSNFSTSHNIPVTISADNANSASGSVRVNVVNPTNGGKINYVAGSSRLTWDENGDGSLDFNMTPIPDGMTSGGLRIGDQSGCNEFIMQLNFLATIEAVQVQPSPTPSATPAVSPSPSATPEGGNANNNTNNNTNNINISNTQTQNQTAASSAPVVLGEKIPLKQPDTGVGVLGSFAMFSAAPIGLLLRKYSRSKVSLKEEESLGGVATFLHRARSNKLA